MRLITVTEESAAESVGGPNASWVNLIHETLIRSKGQTDEGEPQPYWQTLWQYIEQNQERAARRERLHLQAREWEERKGLGKLFGLASWVDEGNMLARQGCTCMATNLSG